MFSILKPISRNALSKIAVPKRTEVSDRWRGIQHGELVSCAADRLQKFGFKIKGERFDTTMDGAGLVGSFDLMPTARVKINVPKGIGLAFGIQHDNLGRRALRILAGAKVLVCSNGMIRDIFSPAAIRRHTSGVNLADVIDGGIQQFAEISRTQIAEDIRKLQGMPIRDDRHAHSILIESAKQDVCPWSSLRKVEENWRTPPHPEFKERNAWSLLNAFTEVAKEFSPTQQVRSIHGARALVIRMANTSVNRN